MQAFEYIAVKTIGEAVSLLTEHGDRVCILSGGTDILVQLREGRKHAQHVIDVKEVPELSELRFDPHTGLTVGAAVACHCIYEHETVSGTYPGIVDAASLIGGIQIQSRATFGGNLCNASPAADSIPSLIAHHAVCHIVGPKGERHLPVEQFCVAPGRNALAPGEILVSLHLPVPTARSSGAYQRFTPRNEMDIAVAGVGAVVELDSDLGHFRSIRLGLGAVAPTPLLVEVPEEMIAAKPISGEVIGSVAAFAQAATSPITDMRGSARQRKHLIGVLVQRVIQKSVERVQKTGEVS